MRTEAQRNAAYEARMQSTLIDPALTAVAALASANYTIFTLEFVPKQQALRALLDAGGLSPTAYAGYEAFNGQMYHVWKTCAGASAVAYATILVTKYTTWLGPGAAALLKSIASGLYGIVVP